MIRSVEVVPFFERFGECEEGWSGESYVTGFRNADGSPAGVEVVVPAEIVQHAVLSKCGLSLSMNSDGTFALHAEGLHDDSLDAASRPALAAQSLESLLKECLNADLFEMEDDPAAALRSLRSQLVAGLSLVESALKQLQRK